MFGASFFPVDAVVQATSGITSVISENVLPILGMLGFMVALSVVMALLDMRREQKLLDDYAKRWKQ